MFHKYVDYKLRSERKKYPPHLGHNSLYKYLITVSIATSALFIMR